MKRVKYSRHTLKCGLHTQAEIKAIILRVIYGNMNLTLGDGVLKWTPLKGSRMTIIAHANLGRYLHGLAISGAKMLLRSIDERWNSCVREHLISEREDEPSIHH